MIRITSCRICNNKEIIEFLDLGDQPYANSLLKNKNEKERFYPLSLSWCSKCNLVQLNHTADPKELFTNYVWVTSISKIAREYAKVFYRDIIARTKKAKKGYILEIASNDGTFLLPFMKAGYKVLGIDSAKNIVSIARENGVPTKCEFFDLESATRIVKEYGLAKVIIARNVLPHVANLHSFVKGIARCLDDEGLLAVEFHYAKKIYEDLHYDSIYHEHLCYFTIKSLERLFNRYNLFIKDIKTSPISGGSLVVYAIKGKVRESTIVKTYRQAEEKVKVNTLESWKDFADRTDNHRKKLLKILTDNKDKKIVGYGASARSSTMLNFCKINTDLIPIIADQNSLKQGLYTAGTHILIDSPDNVMKRNPNLIVLLAWNFGKEIIKILKEKYKFKGKLIIPLPKDPKIVALQM